MAKDWRSGLEGRLKEAATELSGDISAKSLTLSNAAAGEQDVLADFGILKVTKGGHLRFPTTYQGTRPRHAAYGLGNLIYSATNVPAGGTVSVGAGQDASIVRVFKFVVAVADDWDVKIGADADASWTNMKYAMEMADTPGQGNNGVGGLYKVPSYADGTENGDYVAWPAINPTSNALDLTAYPAGEWSNSLAFALGGGIVIPTHVTNFYTFATNGQGHDCVPGKAGDIFIGDDGYIYFCGSDTTPGTVSGAWFRQAINGAVGSTY